MPGLHEALFITLFIISLSSWFYHDGYEQTDIYVPPFIIGGISLLLIIKVLNLNKYIILVPTCRAIYYRNYFNSNLENSESI